VPDNDYEVLISADVGGLTSAMQEAGAATDELKGHLEGIGESGEEAGEAFGELKEKAEEGAEGLAKLGEGLTGMAEILGVGALGEALQRGIEEFIELGVEVQRTATIMGSSNADAHAWVDAAELSWVSANSFTQAARAMNSQVSAGGKQLQEMGISMRDTDGAMKSSGELIEETITKLESYSASADRNALAQKTLGRGWIDLVANGQELIANLEQQKEEFANAGVSENQLVGQTKALQAAMAEMHIAWMEIVTSAGPALIGILKSVADSLAYVAYMAESARAAIENMFAVAIQVHPNQHMVRQSQAVHRFAQ
jgi:hypothetical protein